MSAAIGSTALVNGFEMYHEVRGEGEPLVLLHGFMGASGDWVHLFDLDALAREYQLIVPDLRGHGRSTNPEGTFSMRQCARDVLALLDGLGIERCKAVGLSLGGNTLLHVATAQPERVESMIAISATSHFTEQARAIMAAVTVESQTEEDWRQMRERHRHGDDQIRALWRQGNAFKDSYDDMNFTRASLSTITARTLVVGGDRDPFYPVEIFVDLYRAIPRASLWIVPNGGHACVFGEIRDEFVRTARAFLRGA